MLLTIPDDDDNDDDDNDSYCDSASAYRSSSQDCRTLWD